ncbi:pitrilysin family protein [soil metagenome]
MANRRRAWLALILIFPALLLSACAGIGHTKSKTKSTMSVRQYKLNNGLTLNVQQDKSIALVTMDMWVKVGSGDEPAEIAGVSHFLEHMLFKGTQKLAVGEYDRKVEEAGGYLNAATGQDYTHYYVTAPSAQFAMLLDNFADVLVNSSIDAKEVDSERQVILEEISRKLDSPFGFLFDETLPALYETGPYTHPVIGSRDTVTSTTRAQLFDHYQRFYTPANMYLSVVGDVDPEAVKEEAEKAFAKFDRKLNPHRAAAPETKFRAAKDTTLLHDWNEAYFLIAFPGPAGDSMKSMAVAEMAEVLLAGGRASRLVKELQEKKAIVSSVGFYAPTHRTASPLIIYGACEPAKLDEVKAAALAEITKAKQHGFSGGEMSRARRQVLNSHLYSMETNAGRASVIGYSQVMLGNNSLMTDYPDAIRDVSEHDVMEFLRANLTEAKASFHVTMRDPAAVTP